MLSGSIIITHTYKRLNCFIIISFSCTTNKSYLRQKMNENYLCTENPTK